MKHFINLFENYTDTNHFKEVCQASTEFQELLKWGYVIEWRDIEYNMESFHKVIYSLYIWPEFVEAVSPEFQEWFKTPAAYFIVKADFLVNGLKVQMVRSKRWNETYRFEEELYGSTTEFIKIDPPYKYDTPFEQRVSAVIASFQKVLKMTAKMQYELENAVDWFGNKTGYLLKHNDSEHQEKRTDRGLTDTIDELW